MDNVKFAKFCKDCKVIDGKNITTTEIDITFNKLKAHGQRKIDFDTFVEILQDLAPKKYPNKSGREAYKQLLSHISHKEPLAHNVTEPETEGVFDKLLDPENYTGMHHYRFNADGTGRGIEGRTQQTGTVSQQQITNRNSNAVIPNDTPNVHTMQTRTGSAQKRGMGASTEDLDAKTHASKKADHKSSQGNLKETTTTATHKSSTTTLNKATNNKGSNASLNKATGNKGSNASLNKQNNGSNASLNKQNNGSNSSLNKQSGNYSANNKGGNNSVFDRLTDTNQYTGTHKERFNADGTGKGIAGREQTTGTLTQAQVTNRSTNSAVLFYT
jgi:hypothetical protein